jgi:dTDP-glucose 4,6-dehydratase
VRYTLDHTTDNVVVVDKLTYAGNLANLAQVSADSRYTFVRADVADRPAMAQVFAAHRPNGVLNLAAETHVDRSIDSPQPFIDANITGTFVLLDVARQFVRGLGDEDRKTFRFLHVSTDEVYGTLGPSGTFNEDTPYAPNSPYAASKAAADHLVRSYFHTYGLPALITNCSNNYGPYQFPEKLIPLMILNALEGRPLPIYGDGGNVRDWLHVEDHCAGLLLAFRQGRPGEKYNIGGSGECTNVEVVDRLCDALEALRPSAANSALEGKAGYRALKTFVADRPGHDRRYAIDASKIARELGWKARRTFADGIVETARWYLENRDWCDEVQRERYGRERLGLSQ